MRNRISIAAVTSIGALILCAAACTFKVDGETPTLGPPPSEAVTDGTGGISANGGTSSSLGGTLGSGGASSPVGGSSGGFGGSAMGGASGGVAAIGDAPTAGGAMATGGAAATGGAISTGGKMATGGATATGGASATGGTITTGGTTTTGGKTATGGASATGGVLAAGGVLATGGTTATGGALATGGTTSTGGSLATGGTTSTGGALATGGTTATGGSLATGGALASGGTSIGGASAISSDLAILNAHSPACGICAQTNCPSLLGPNAAQDSASGTGSCLTPQIAGQSITVLETTTNTNDPFPMAEGTTYTGDQVCLDLLACLITSKCDVGGVLAVCYCGAAQGTDCLDVANYPGGTADPTIQANIDNGTARATGPINGACCIEEINAAKSTVPETIASSFGDMTLPMGPANQLVYCLSNANCTACFQ